MPELSLKEAIEILSAGLKVCKELADKNGMPSDMDKKQQALSLAISKLSLLEQVEEKGIREEIIKRLRHETDFGIQNYGAIADEIIDFYNAHLVKKLDAEEIERIVISCKKQTEASCPHCNKNSTWTQINSYELSQAIKTYLAKNDT